MWTCKRYAALLAPYSENALSERDGARVRAHLDACPACRAEMATLREISTLLRAHKPPAPEPAADLWGRIQAEIAPAPARVRPRPTGWRAGLALPVAGLAAAALVVGAVVRPWAGPVSPVRDRSEAVTAPTPADPRVVAEGKPEALHASPAETARPDPFRPMQGEPPRNLAAAEREPAAPRRISPPPPAAKNSLQFFAFKDKSGPAGVRRGVVSPAPDNYVAPKKGTGRGLQVARRESLRVLDVSAD